MLRQGVTLVSHHPLPLFSCPLSTPNTGVHENSFIRYVVEVFTLLRYFYGLL